MGLARQKLGKHAAAIAAIDKALVIDTNYAPALHAIATSVKALGGPNGARDAAQWYSKALAANPKYSPSGIEAARAYQSLEKFGHYRRTLKATVAHVDRGLPANQRPSFMYRVATEFDEQGRIAEVAPFVQEAARLQPGNDQYVAVAATALSESGKPKEGLALIDPVVKRNPNGVDGLIARARIYVRLDDIAKGFIDLDQARKLAPTDPRIPLWEARFHTQLGKFTDAKKALLRATRVAGSNPAPFIEQGRLELRLGNIEAAYEAATAAVKVAPTDARAHGLLGACYARRGQLKEAEQSYKRASELDDEDLAARLGYANALRDQKGKGSVPARLAKAVPLYLKAMADEPDNPQTMFEYGRLLEMQGNLRSALSLYEKAAVLDARDVRPHLKMVAAYLDPATKDIAAAQRALKAAQSIEINGGLSLHEVRYWEGRVAYDRKKPREAVAAMRAAVEAAPSNPTYQYWMGRVFESKDDAYEAVIHYKKAIALNSRFAEPIRALGQLELDRNRFTPALEYFDKYRRVAPQDLSIFVEIGDSYSKQNRDGQAEKAYRRALRSDPTNVRALVQIGDIMDRRGRSADAVKYWNRAAKADPKNGEAVCKAAIGVSKGRVTSRSRQGLERCVELESTPEYLRTQAEEILSQ